LHSARSLLWSFDFGEIEALQRAGRSDDATEIMLLVKQEDSRVPLFDTTRIHAEAGADRALL
jgi:aspartate/glutamate racemase